MRPSPILMSIAALTCAAPFAAAPVKLSISRTNKTSDRTAANVHLVIDNRSGSSIRYKASRPEIQFQVRDQHNKPAARTKYGLSLLPPVRHDPLTVGLSGWSGPTLELAPGASMGDDLDISRVYQMTANGTYTITASWVVPVSEEFIDQTAPPSPTKPTPAVVAHSNVLVVRRTPQGFVWVK